MGISKPGMNNRPANKRKRENGNDGSKGSSKGGSKGGRKGDGW